MLNGLREFFQDDAKQLSMTRLLTFLSFLPATVMMFLLRTETAYEWYLTIFVLHASVNKGMEVWQGKNNNKEGDDHHD